VSVLCYRRYVVSPAGAFRLMIIRTCSGLRHRCLPITTTDQVAMQPIPG
jgi:hypothetical protein